MREQWLLVPSLIALGWALGLLHAALQVVV